VKVPAAKEVEQLQLYIVATQVHLHSALDRTHYLRFDFDFDLHYSHSPANQRAAHF
jgi:hypothetical protein